MAGKIQHRFTKGKLCLTNLYIFYDKVSCLVDVGQAGPTVDTGQVYLYFSMAFHMISHSCLLNKLRHHLSGEQLCGKRPWGSCWMNSVLLWQRKPTGSLIALTRTSPAKIKHYLTLLLSAWQATSGTLCSVLALALQKPCGQAGDSPEKDQKDDQRNEKPALQEN